LNHEGETKVRRRVTGSSIIGGNSRSPLGNRIPLIALIQMLAVAEYLNFRHAANVLGVSQSSISARIKALEEELGIFIFERHPRGVRLTEAGRQFIAQVSVGVDKLDHAVRTASMIARGDYGHLRIGVHALLPHSFPTRLIQRYRELNPNIILEITEGSTRDELMMIRENALDVALIAGESDIPDVRSRRVWTECLIIAFPSGHRLARQSGVVWQDLTQEAFLVRRGGTGPQLHDHIVMRLAGPRLVPTIQRFDVGRGALLSMVAQGFGITLLGAPSSWVPTPGVVFLPLLDEPEPITFSAVWSPHNRSPALRKFLALASKLDQSPSGV
jgi:DNA-binding transcriptional LysR family regulator